MPEDILEGPGSKLGNSRRRILQTLLHAAEPLAVDQLARESNDGETGHVDAMSLHDGVEDCVSWSGSDVDDPLLDEFAAHCLSGG